MEIKIKYDDGRTFTTQIPNGNIASVTMLLANQNYVKTRRNFDVFPCDEPQDRFTYDYELRNRK